MKTVLKIVGIVLAALILIYIVGPRPEPPTLSPDIAFNHRPVEEVVQSVRVAELQVDHIKKDNESRILLADPENPSKTPYALVYLHGFSASPEEGSPTHEEFASYFGMNFYAPRLYDHGLDVKDALGKFTGQRFIESAKEAIEVGLQLGDSIIVMSCSTGGTASLYLAAHNPEIHSLILLSPNIELANPITSIVTKPWGKQILKLVLGGEYVNPPKTEVTKKYWNASYRYESIIELKSLLKATMTDEIFAKVTQPVYAGYYYKNEDEQDHVVSVPSILDMYDALGTPSGKKRKKAFPNVGNHVICSKYVSKNCEHVTSEVIRFGEEVLGLKKAVGQPQQAQAALQSSDGQ